MLRDTLPVPLGVEAMENGTVPRIEDSKEVFSYHRSFHDGSTQHVQATALEFFRVGCDYHRRRRFRDASIFYNELLNRGYSDFALIHNLATVQYAHDRVNEAIRLLSSQASVGRDHAVCRETLGYLYQRLGDGERALAHYGDGGTTTWGDWHRALLLEKRGSGSASSFEQLLAVQPESGLADLVRPDGAVKVMDWLRANATLPVRVIFGGHWSDNPGWLDLTQMDQNICLDLIFPTASVDVSFNEHVLEHVDFRDGVHFLKESFRILKPGGVLRIVCPMLERLERSHLEDVGENVTYLDQCLAPAFSEDMAAVPDLAGLRTDPDFFRMWLFAMAFYRSEHKMIWSARVLKRILETIGFRDVAIREIGDGVDPEFCIERRRRGLYHGFDWREDREGPAYNADTMVVEAVK
ncbi:MAG: methyltransferase domain-containing protein [Alphaproteobacteria bacterium]